VRALSYLPTAKADFSPRALEEAQRAHDLGHTFQKNFSEPLQQGIPLTFLDRDFQKAMGLAAWRGVQAALGRGWLWNRNGRFSDGIANMAEGLPADYRPVQAMRDGKPISNPPETPAFVGPVDDPMRMVLAQQSQEFALRDQERTQRIADSERELMTIGDRFKSIRQEMGPLAQQIAQRKDALKTPEGFLTDAQRESLAGITGFARTIQVNEMREKFMDQTAEMQVRLNKERADLRQRPLNFQADNLSKVGLYSANALAFNPVLGLNKTNEILLKIAQNTAKPNVQAPNNPHRP
jgi:hypothetical protein